MLQCWKWVLILLHPTALSSAQMHCPFSSFFSISISLHQSLVVTPYCFWLSGNSRWNFNDSATAYTGLLSAFATTAIWCVPFLLMMPPGSTIASLHLLLDPYSLLRARTFIKLKSSAFVVAFLNGTRNSTERTNFSDINFMVSSDRKNAIHFY